ncbi:hypothetical protein EB796_021913 [Bugula neritina]|uniref:TMCC1 n=1 Tax=Bugula neritina TaxID=10212 RepID=A0A7J7J0R7_BUGNE|nr:hypothetical protein EB796_021913 [Bugula neritina]
MMKKFEFRNKKSPLPGKKGTMEKHLHADSVEDGGSDYTDSEPGGLLLEIETTDSGRNIAADPSKHRNTINAYKLKIDKIRMEIQKEQIIKEDHVQEYLDLSSKASHDESKVKNIKLVFEKNNSVSAQRIANLQKKMEKYQNDLRNIEQHGTSHGAHRAAKEMLKDVGQGLKDFGGTVVDNIRTATDALVSKPKENSGGSGKSKSGSADNINSLTHNFSHTGTSSESPVPAVLRAGSPSSPTGSTTLPANFKMTVPGGTESDNEGLAVAESGSLSEASYHFARDSPHASSTSNLIQNYNQAAIEPLLQKLNRNAESLEVVAREIDMLRSQMSEFQEELAAVRSSLEEERMADRYERLEEHLNDFVELTQNELSNLKQEMSNMEEKIDYQLEERTRDLQEALETANTRIAKIELQNQQQQLISMEGVDNPNAKVMLTKVINVLLAFLAVLLVFMSTVSNVVGPLMNAKWKVATILVLVFVIILTSSQWVSFSGAIPNISRRHAYAEQNLPTS